MRWPCKCLWLEVSSLQASLPLWCTLLSEFQCEAKRHPTTEKRLSADWFLRAATGLENQQRHYQWAPLAGTANTLQRRFFDLTLLFFFAFYLDHSVAYKFIYKFIQV